MSYRLKQIIINIKWLIPSIINKMIMRLRRIKYGKHLLIYGLIFIRGTGKISIGNNVKITSCRETNPIGGDVRTILFAKGNGLIYIGDNTGLSNSSIVATCKIQIGDNVMIGGNCKIYDNDFHSLDYNDRILNNDQKVKSAPVIIKNGAFIGAHSIILKGVTIGENSIIGAGSVVTKSVPDGQIWAGNPAKFIRRI